MQSPRGALPSIDSHQLSRALVRRFTETIARVLMAMIKATASSPIGSDLE